MGLIKPRWHSLPWNRGPQLLKAATDELADYPRAARAVYLAEAALGIMLAAQRDPER